MSQRTMKIHTSVILVLLSLASSSCQEKLETTVQYNKSFTAKTFSRILVDTGCDDPEINKNILHEFDKIGVKAINSLELFPRLNNLGVEELNAIYSKFDGVVRCRISHFGNASKNILRAPSINLDYEISLTDVLTDEVVVTFTTNYEDGDPNQFVESFYISVMPELQTVLQP
jgi:hypothetical protein